MSTTIQEQVAASLTDEALAYRLRLAVKEPGGFSRRMRDALMAEAATRIERRLGGPR